MRGSRNYYDVAMQSYLKRRAPATATAAVAAAAAAVVVVVSVNATH
jgi:hypothetical protein